MEKKNLLNILYFFYNVAINILRPKKKEWHLKNTFNNEIMKFVFTYRKECLSLHLVDNKEKS